MHLVFLGAGGVNTKCRREISLPSCRSHYWSTPGCVPEQCPTTSGDQARCRLTALCSSVSQPGLRLLCSHSDLLQSLLLATFCPLVPPFPGQEVAEVALAPQWRWEEGEQSESTCRSGSLCRALLIAQLSAFKSTYFPYQGVRLSHLISFHYIFD